MKLNRETVYDLENTYDAIADEDEEMVDKMFTKVQALHEDIVKRHQYKADDIDNELVTHMVQAAKTAGVDEKWAKGYLFYKYFDEE